MGDDGPIDEPPPTPQRLVAGRYDVRALIGRGEASTVFRAFDRGRGEEVALEQLARALTSPEARTRFEAEWRAANRLDHPGLVRGHDVFQDQGETYITAELVDGRNLEQLLDEEGPLEPARANALLAQVASALDALHREGVVHRDVQPSSILVESGPQGERAVLASVGLVRALEGSEPARSRSPCASPEQRRGQRSLSPQADVFGLGCVALACLTGTTPELAHGGAPAATAVRPELPAAVDREIARALASDPRRRHASAGRFAEALAAALRTPSDGALPGDLPPPTRWKVAGRGVQAVQLLLLLVILSYAPVALALGRGKLWICAAAVAAAFVVLLLIQTFTRVRGGMPISGPPQVIVASAVEATLRIPGWRLVGRSEDGALLELPRRVQLVPALFLAIFFVLPGLAYILHRRVYPEIVFLVTDDDDGTQVLLVEARGTEASREVMSIQRQLHGRWIPRELAGSDAPSG